MKKVIIIAIVALVAVYFLFFRKKDNAAATNGSTESAAAGDVPAADPRTYLDPADAEQFDKVLGTTKWLANDTTASWHKQIADSTQNPNDLWWNAWRAIIHCVADDKSKTTTQRAVFQGLPRVDVALAYSAKTGVQVA